MEKSGSEILIYILLIGGFLLFNYITQQFARKAREQQEAAAQDAAAQEASANPPEEDVLEDIWGRIPAGTPQILTPQPAPAPARRAALQAADASVRRAAAARNLFRNRQELRHAIVLMTVLGPCKVLDPPENRQ